MIEMIECLYCKIKTPKTRKNKKFCSDKCRVYYHLKKEILAEKERITAAIRKVLEEI